MREVVQYTYPVLTSVKPVQTLPPSTMRRYFMGSLFSLLQVCKCCYLAAISISLLSTAKLDDAEHAQVIEAHHIFIKNNRWIITGLNSLLEVHD